MIEEREDDNRFIHRDISWLSFNYRVLQEAKDRNVPLLERLKFLAIYSSNLDEFFKVRVAQHHRLVQVGKKTKKELDYNPKQILKEIHKIVNAQQLEISNIFENQIVPELRHYDISLIRRTDLNSEQKEYVEEYFRDRLLPYVQPVLLVKNKIRVFLTNASLYLAVHMQPKDNYTAPTEYAIVRIPSDYEKRFVALPSRNSANELIMLDDIVRHSISWLFPGYDIYDTYSVKLTRDADLYIEDEFSGNLIQKIKSSIRKRNVGPASRFVYDREMPSKMLTYLSDTLNLEKYDLIPEGRYHNNFDFFRFPDYGLTHLKYKSLTPITYPLLENKSQTHDDFFAQMREKDHLIHPPYHSYESVIRFFEHAADDPKVSDIKIVQYRVAKKSRIMQALIRAVKNGKQVSVFIEVKARFDEEANLQWGETLQEAGVTVHYSMPGIKVHSKLALVKRKEGRGGKACLYSYFGTGNFNEDTAKIYSDFSLFTTDPRLTNEMARVFNYLETGNKPLQPFEHLLVGQFNLRCDFVAKIEREIQHAKAGKSAAITLKVNSIEDREMILKLYEASAAGVKIRIVVRGICSLKANEKGLSENIQAISIVDRFLEHARVFIFHNDDNEEIYLSSADWMQRNLSSRVETAFPIYDLRLQKIIKETIQLQFNDNVKARIVSTTQNNDYQKVNQNDNDLAIRSQIETYFYVKNLE